jgi:putative ABC transport system substrate-binding protein
MKRREFIGFAGVAAASWPLVVWAEQATKMPRIGLLSPSRSDSSDASRPTLDALVTGLRELGYTEGQNIAIEREFGGANADRLRELAAELVKRRVNLIVAFSTTAARPAKQATSVIPIVGIAMADPVADELVASLARPGGNVTGTTFLGPELVTKRLQLLAQVRERHFLAPNLLPSDYSCSLRWCPNTPASLSSGIHMPTVIAQWQAWSRKPSRQRRPWVCSFNLCQ